MQNKYESNTLFVPANIRTRLEFFDGFGIPELMITAITTAIVTVLCIILNAIFEVNNTKLVFAVLVTMATAVTATVKTESNISMVDQVGFLLAFNRAQKRYDYLYWGDWI